MKAAQIPPDLLPSRADDMFCHAVYTASHAINRAYAPHLKALGLTYPQYMVLMLLAEGEGQRVGDLAGALEIETSTMTPLLKRMEGRGLIERRRSRQDERQVLVFLTEAGREAQARSPGITACMVEGTGLSLAELEELQGLLKRLRAGFADPPPQ